MNRIEGIDAYPLQWPIGWPRNEVRVPARFHAKVKPAKPDPSNPSAPVRPSYVTSRKVTVAEARDRLLAELQRCGAEDIVISSNAKVRADGLIRGDTPEKLEDPGAAVYFRLKKNGRLLVSAADKWTRLADNLIALAKTFEADRGKEHWGVGTREQAFSAYQLQLTAVEKKPWYVILGFKKAPETRMALNERYRNLMREHHPDLSVNQASNRAAEINVAYAEGNQHFLERKS